jgi:mRNA interferase MazF
LAVVEAPQRYEIWLVAPEPSRGAGGREARPAVIVSPDEMNRHVEAVIIAPMTTAARAYPTRVPVRFEDKDGQIALEQIRTIDKARLVRRAGALPQPVARQVAGVLVELFAYE